MLETLKQPSVHEVPKNGWVHELEKHRSSVGSFLKAFYTGPIEKRPQYPSSSDVHWTGGWSGWSEFAGSDDWNAAVSDVEVLYDKDQPSKMKITLKNPDPEGVEGMYTEFFVQGDALKDHFKQLSVEKRVATLKESFYETLKKLGEPNAESLKEHQRITLEFFKDLARVLGGHFSITKEYSRTNVLKDSGDGAHHPPSSSSLSGSPGGVAVLKVGKMAIAIGLPGFDTGDSFSLRYPTETTRDGVSFTEDGDTTPADIVHWIEDALHTE